MLNVPSKKQQPVLDMLFHGQEILDKVYDSTELEGKVGTASCFMS